MDSSANPLDAETIVGRIRAEVQRRKRERDLRAARPSLAPPPDVFYRWDDRLTFGSGGSGLGYLREGWSGPEENFTWSAGPFAGLELPITNPPGDMCLAFEAHAFVSPRLPFQQVRLLIDGVLLAQWSVADPAVHSAALFHRHLSGRNLLALHFEFPHACSPRSVGIGDDPRTLGMALKSLTIGRLAVK